jgi:hypothetical protein
MRCKWEHSLLAILFSDSRDKFSGASVCYLILIKAPEWGDVCYWQIVLKNSTVEAEGDR